MNKRRSGFLGNSSQLEQTFRFDSRAEVRGSKSKSSLGNDQFELNLSQRTSEYVRLAEGGNDNILELLEQSEEDRKTSKAEKEGKKDLWDFFARFDKESNPDITISDISVIPHKKEKQNKYQDKQLNQRARELSNTITKTNKSLMRRHQNGSQSGSQYSEANFQQNWHQNQQANQRYPKRNRVQPAKYWLGEKYQYKHGMITGIARKDLEGLEK